MSDSVILTTPEQLAKIVRTAVDEALADRATTDQPSEWLDADGVAELLSVHRRTVVKWARSGGLPSRRIGALLRFRRTDVHAWVERGRGANGPTPMRPRLKSA